MTMIIDGTNGGFFPSWTTATRPASPTVGQMGYNTTIGQFDCYTSGGWVSVLNTTSTSNKPISSQMPTGSVLQVVQSVYTTRYTTSTTGSWVSPGMTGSITPSSTSSKILVSVNVVIGNSGGGSTNGATIRLTRNSSAISYLNRTSAGNPAGTYQSYNGFNSGTVHLDYLDSPSSVSSVTYGVDAWWEGGTSYGTFNTDRDNTSGAQGNATVTMMEVAG